MAATNERKSLDYYLGLSYPVTIHPSEEGGFVGEIEELDGCFTQGETVQEVMDNVAEAKALWMEVTTEDGRDIPLPRNLVDYSGDLHLRVPKSLHRALAETANREGVSINQLAVAYLSERFGFAQVVLSAPGHGLLTAPGQGIKMRPGPKGRRAEVEERFGESLTTLMPRLYKDHPTFAGLGMALGVSWSTARSWVLELGLAQPSRRRRRVAYRPQVTEGNARPGTASPGPSKQRKAG